MGSNGLAFHAYPSYIGKKKGPCILVPVCGEDRKTLKTAEMGKKEVAYCGSHGPTVFLRRRKKREEDGASATRSRHSTQHKKTNDGKCLFLVGGICSIGCCRGQARIRRPKPDRSSISIVFSLSLSFLMFRMCTYTKGLRRRIHKPHAYRRTTVYIYAYSSINPSFFCFAVVIPGTACVRFLKSFSMRTCL